MVQTQTLNNKDIPQDRIAAVVLFGNPYFRAGAPQNKCGAVSELLHVQLKFNVGCLGYSAKPL
jgi:hypothetical protein